MPSIGATVTVRAQCYSGVLLTLLNMVRLTLPRRIAKAARQLLDAAQVLALFLRQLVVHIALRSINHSSRAVDFLASMATKLSHTRAFALTVCPGNDFLSHLANP